MGSDDEARSTNKEDSPEESVDEDVDPDHTNIELVRVIDRTIHVSPVDRKKETDFDIRNVSGEEVNYVFLPLREFKPNLQVYDEDDRILNYYPDSEVRDLVDRVKDEDEEAYKAMQHRFKHTDYKLFIQLPPDSPISPGELRRITLRFEQTETVEFFKLTDPKWYLGWYSDWRKKFFRIPSFLANSKRYPGHPHDEFLVIVGVPGYATTGEVDHNASETKGDFHKNGLDNETRVLQTRLPAARDQPYEWDLQYELIPNKESLMLSLACFWWVAVILGVGSSAIPVLDILDLNSSLLQFTKDQGIGTLAKPLSGAIVTGIIGLIFALDMEWAERYRILSVVPLLMHSLAWVLWSISIPPGS